MQKFLAALAVATTLVDVNIAAGEELERLERSDPSRAIQGPEQNSAPERDLKP